MVSEQEKITYLEEYISYDVLMLNYTFMRMLTSPTSRPEEQLDFNAYLESFGVHARHLVAFLSEKSPGDSRNASDYVPDFEAPDQVHVQQVFSGLEKQILHATAFRATDPQAEFTIDDARELYAWIVPAILRFQSQIGPSYRASLNVHGVEASANGAREAD
jgi:hypothetical protein